MKSLKSALKEAVEQSKWKEIETRGVKWIETLDFSFISRMPTDKEIFSLYKHADAYIARARTEYILEEKSVEEDLASNYLTDMNTRRAIVYQLDWYWHKHPGCVVAVQAMYRSPDMHYFLILRSSNLYNALPYDLHMINAFSRIVEDVWANKFKVMSVENRILHFYATNAHVPSEYFYQFLKLIGVKDVTCTRISNVPKDQRKTLRLGGDNSENTRRKMD